MDKYMQYKDLEEINILPENFSYDDGCDDITAS